MKKHSDLMFIVKFISFFLPIILSKFLSESASFVIFFFVAIFLLSIEYDEKGPVDMVRIFPVCVPLLIFAAYGFYSVAYKKQVALSIDDCAILCYTCLYSLVLLFVGAIQKDK